MTPTTRAWLEITRLSNVPTVLSGVLVMALADPFLVNGWSHPFGVLGILVAIACFYVAGFVFNDVFDRHIDQDERPRRPIPSGRIRPHAAVQVGCLLMVAGLLIIATLDDLFTVEPGEPNGLIDAALLVVLILLYDRFHARSSWMVLVMAACRVLVYTTCLLTLIESREQLFGHAKFWWSGTQAMAILASPWPIFLLSIFIYVAAFSRIARGEVQGGSRGKHFCYRCGFMLDDISAAKCTECGRSLEPKRLARSTSPPPGGLYKFCLVGTLLPWLVIFGFTIANIVIHRAMGQGQTLGVATETINLMYTLLYLAVGVLVGSWFLWVIRAYILDHAHPGNSIQQWIAGICIIDGYIAFYFGSFWVALVCAGLFIVTRLFQRKVSGT